MGPTRNLKDHSPCPTCSGSPCKTTATIEGDDYYSNGPHKNLKDWTHHAQHASALLVSPTAFVEKDDYYSNGPHKNLKEWTHRAQHALALLVSPAASVEKVDYYSNGPHNNLKDWTHHAQHAALLVSPAAGVDYYSNGPHKELKRVNSPCPACSGSPWKPRTILIRRWLLQ